MSATLTDVFTEGEKVRRQRRELDHLRTSRVALATLLQDPESSPLDVANAARYLKRSIENCRRLIPDCDPHVYIDVDDREDGEMLEYIPL